MHIPENGTHSLQDNEYVTLKIIFKEICLSIGQGKTENSGSFAVFRFLLKKMNGMLGCSLRKDNRYWN